MSNIRDEVVTLIQNLPPTVSYEEILYEILVHSHIEKGLTDIQSGNVMTHEQAMDRLKKWAM